MKELTVNSPADYISLIKSNNEFIKEDDMSFCDMNFLFWKTIFSPNNIRETLEFAKIRYMHSENVSLKIQAILNDSKKFTFFLNNALDFSISSHFTKKELFACLETLEMFCDLYTLCYSLPLRLSITEGFIHNKDSAVLMDEYCLLKNYNPYLEFITKTIMPLILKKDPDIIWVKGRPNIATFALIKILKKKRPNIFIGLCDVKTEYFSLYKIKDFLIRNTIIYQLFDCIIFSDIEAVKHMIIDALKRGKSLEHIPGIILKREGKYILSSLSPITKDIVDSKNISLKLFKKNYCYWNKCSFCGINKKYLQSENQQWNLEEAIHVLKERKAFGFQYLWLIDEAIPPVILKNLLKKMRENQLRFIWHLRSRIESELIDEELIDLLKETGVKSIILGFESASNRILRLMKKTYAEDYLEIAEKIVEKYTQHNIHIHFPALIGFPSETVQEREQTLNFLTYLSQKYRLFSYNINILDLDISSELFSHWTDYDINSLKLPCLPKYFLGNSVEWNNDFITLNKCRTDIMLKQFPWYPKQTNIPASVFYNIWERKRGVLYEKYDEEMSINEFDFESNYQLSKGVVFFQTNQTEYCFYNFNTHHFLLGGEIIKLIYNALSQNDSTSILSIPYFEKDIIITFLKDLHRLNFIIKI